MIMNEFARSALAYRRFAEQAKDDGFVVLSENGDPLWKFIRGGWGKYEITDVRIAPGGHQLWIKHNAPEDRPAKRERV
jgi:hypothetical protein